MLRGIVSDMEIFHQLSEMFSKLIALPFKRTHIAATRVLWVGTGHPALIGLQQMTLAVRTATRVARINRRASREQRNRLRWPAVVSQRAEIGRGVVHIAGAIEIASIVAAQVVPLRIDNPAAIMTVNFVGDDAVFNCYRARAGNVHGFVAGTKQVAGSYGRGE